MPGKAEGVTAIDLLWLCPNTDSLVGLAERPAEIPGLVAADPALSAFLLRTEYADARPESFSFTPERFLSPAILETAAAYLEATTAGWLATSAYAIERAKAVAELAAAFAARIAQHAGRPFTAAAAAAAQVAPLGWYAVGAVDPLAAAQALFDPDFTADPVGVQVRLWKLDHDRIARRLALRWRIRPWAEMVAGSLNLPFRIARETVPEPDLFAVVQLAVCEAEDRSTYLGLTRSADRRELLAHLELTEDDVERLCSVPPLPVPARHSDLPPNPHRVPLLRNLLRATATARRRNGASIVVRLEERIDELHRQLIDLGEMTGGQLRDAKLAGLAELAAGAGHEINNPLAVISGNAQRLLRTEPDPDRGDSLRSIVRQTQRIHSILRDLMLFARPTKPVKSRSQVSDVVAAVAAQIEPLAAERGVRLDLVAAPADLHVDADPKQLQHVLLAVVRNGVEAVPKGGWVRLACETTGGVVRLVVEDSGPGLTEEAVEHAFDPFFCGRSAGRGRGLGLSTAWQLARQNGGDVRFEPTKQGPTRFVVTAPLASAGTEWSERKSA